MVGTIKVIKLKNIIIIIKNQRLKINIMLKKLNQTNKLQQIILITSVTAFGLLVLAFRIHKTDSIHFMFLIWNLFLAGIPWIVSSLLIVFPKLRKRYLVLIPAGIIWLLFIPNTFYILTDLFHLNYKNYLY